MLTDKEKQIIKRSNEVVLADYMAGKSLSVISVHQTNFPPRSIIKKDKDALTFIHEFKPKLCLVDSDL